MGRTLVYLRSEEKANTAENSEGEQGPPMILEREMSLGHAGF